MLRPLLLCVTLFSLSYASVEVYQDKVKLSYLPSQKFVGFNKNVKLSSTNGSLRLVQGSCENIKSPACKSLNIISKLNAENRSLQKQKQILNLTLNEALFDTKDAQKTMAYIEMMSNKIVSIENQIEHNNFLIIKENTKRVLNSKFPYFLDDLAKSTIELEFSGVSFGSEYELNLDKKRLKHKLFFVNRSGIDIKKSEAKIFDRALVGLENNYKFQPRLIYVNSARPMKKRAFSQSMMQSEEASLNKLASAVPRAIKESTRIYKIKNFSLDSDGMKKFYTVEEKNIKLQLQTQWNTWENKVFKLAKLHLDEGLEAKSLNLIYKNAMTKNVRVRSEGKNLIFNVIQEYDLSVKREKIPNYSKDKGLFNSDTQIQHAYKLLISNPSKQTKKLIVVLRIPVSTQENIRVDFKGLFLNKENKEVKYTYYKKLGKVEFTIQLKAGESRKYNYAFTIKHPKNMPISY